MRLGGVRRGLVATVAITATLVAGGMGAGVAQAATNPDPLTDLGASLLPLATGGTQRICATSHLGIPVHCVEHVNFLPSADGAADADTLGHWIFCKIACGTTLLRHELVHVGQFETYGYLFGPMYLAEAAIHGDGCANQYERPAYQANGGC